MKEIYQVPTNLYTLEVKVIKVIKMTDSNYWNEANIKNQLQTKYHKSFETIEDAKKYMKDILEIKIMSLKSSLEYYENKLLKFNEMYNQ